MRTATFGRPTATPKVTVTEITPTMAGDIIAMNKKNRKVRPAVVEAYARAMTAGQWQLTGEAIKFDTEGNLIDGQHRIMAIIRAGVPVTMTVIRGVDAEAQAVMDSGVKRQAHDYFGMNGMANSAVLAAIARLVLKLEGVNLKLITNAEIIDWVEHNPQSHAAAEVASAYRNSIDIHTSVLGVAWLRLSDLDRPRAEEFFESIAQNRTDGNGDPRNALIRRMGHARRSSERLSQDVQLSMVFRAWNAWITGEKMLKIQTETRAGVVRIPAPVPFGTKPRRGRVTRDDLTEQDYQEFDWPTMDSQPGPVAPSAS